MRVLICANPSLRFFAPFSTVFCCVFIKWNELPPSLPMVVCNVATVSSKRGLPTSPTREGSSPFWSSFANVRHSERVSTIRSPTCAVH